MRLSSLSILAFSFRVDRGILYSSDNCLSKLVRLCCLSATALRTRSWLSFRVRRIRLRRSSTPPVDIGVDALPSQPHYVRLLNLNALGSDNYLIKVDGSNSVHLFVVVLSVL